MTLVQSLATELFAAAAHIHGVSICSADGGAAAGGFSKTWSHQVTTFDRDQWHVMR